MNAQKIFTDSIRLEIEQQIVKLVNLHSDIITDNNNLTSPRSVGDALQELLAEHFEKILLPYNVISEYSQTFARRSMADFAFTGLNNCYYNIDVKTHNTETKFNMPNIVSVERLARFYEDDSNYFTILMIAYHINQAQKIEATNCYFIPLEYLHWDCLTIGALGWGQIQISNSHHVIIDNSITRKKWMLSLCDKLDEFYPKEISKIRNRIIYFEKIRTYWQNK